MQVQAFDIGQTQAQIFGAQSKAATDKLNALANSVPANEKQLRKTAEDFEAVFLGQMLKPMFETIESDGFFSGGHAEEVYRGMMVEEVGKSISKAGGVGIAESVYQELLKLQQV
ncbi:rod-binding protein [Kordiimonas sp. SCSIO 12603]|uniref:rod-binding protein n=1 Tax=Kordiimonas sp. SCSIO 12603 TaxID=2829596 RepID=UPI002105F1C1|nr:rod-binding protein [Kordiimonas sp. SCSIO 12603]UTW57614.1 rod-binding protein [Kordiimonas sp. SCSIO 12603]